jgi:hypothetical protein
MKNKLVCVVRRARKLTARMLSGSGLVLALLASAALASAAYEGPREVTIPDIQVTDDPTGDSPLVGWLVNVEGVVTAVVPDGAGLAGYFIQERASASWAGVYVADSTGNRPVVGDLVRIVARVAELEGLTALTDVREFTVLHNAVPLPAAVGLTLGAISADAEPWESVRVAVHHVTVADVGLSPPARPDEWLVGDSTGHLLRVGRLLGGYAFAPIPTEELLTVRGLLELERGNPVLQPAGTDDVVRRGSVMWISEIQAVADPEADDASPLIGERVTTSGVVTAVYPPEDGGTWFTLQDPLGGAWSGVWVGEPRSGQVPMLGTFVSLSGEIVETFGRTELRAAPPQVVVHSVRNLGPAPTRVSAAAFACGRACAERYEGVLVQTGRVTVVDPNPDAPDDFGEWLIADARAGRAARVDDLASYNYDPVRGAKLAFVRGVVDFTFGDFKLQPRNNGDIGEPIASTPTPSAAPTSTPKLPPTPPTLWPSFAPTSTLSVVPTPGCKKERCGDVDVEEVTRGPRSSDDQK